ncbi:efflux RND transporter periplasmic adaptor subunit [Ciceribacter azotifigens]|uniref:efflux RND transporter periplasmic adaptor subunit n=1 Tax=Ciceribacter azotifigens TaxID=2069303 RepID=UPI003A8975FA
MSRRFLLPSLFLLVTAALAGCNDSGDQKAGAGAGAERPPSPVSVVIMKKAEQPLTTLLPGRAAAFQVAEIRPRVSGIIKEIAFKEGGEVKEGELLYKIEDDTYRAQVAQAEASLSKAEASVPSAEANLARYERLVGSGATQIEFENAKVTLLQAKADVAEAKAALNSAQINLNLTEIRAPFEGVTSASNFSIGNVVTANQTDALTTLRRLDPIYIELTESSANLLRLKQSIAAGRLNEGSGNDTADIHLTLEDGIEYPHVGKLDMSDMAVSQTTGTYSIRAVFDNPDNMILPGMYVRASVTVGKENGYLIPQRAAMRDARGQLIAKFVNAQNTVETRTFSESNVSGNNWLVTEGITDGDKLIVDGFQWIGDGAPVAPVEATVDAKGFVVEAPKATEATPAAKP